MHGNLQQATRVVKAAVRRALALLVALLLAFGNLTVLEVAAATTGVSPGAIQEAYADEDEDAAAAEEAARLAQEEADLAAAQAVADAIAALPDPAQATEDDRAAVDSARAALDALTAEQLAYLDSASLSRLEDVESAVAAAEEAARQAAEDAERQAAEEAERQAAEEAARLAKEEADRAAAQAVADAIAALPDPAQATEGDRAAVDSARAALDALTQDQAAYVDASAVGRLEDVEVAVAAAEEEAARKAAEEEAAQSSESSPKKRHTIDEDPDAIVQLELYATATNPDGNWVKPVLDDADDGSGLRWLNNGIKEKGGRMKLLVRASWGDGRAFWQYDEDWRAIDLRYESSDTDVATVSSGGIVTATGDGEAVFTVTDPESGLSAQLGMRIAGQSGAFVTEVYVCDETGYQYEDERITFKDTQNKLNLYVRQVFSDGSTASNAPGADDCNPDALTPVTWAVGDSEIGSVNADTGVFIPSALGSVKVYATATGGDPDVKEGKVRGFVWVVIDDGDYGTAGDMPSDGLTINVIYDAYDEKNDDGSYKYVAKQTKRYSIDELKAIETAQCTYTLTRSDGAYVTASAEGIHLLTLIELAGIDIDQVKSFTFTALDGVNPGKMTYNFLFGERYWWPNYEFGGNMQDAQSVFPMLAWASDWRDSKSGADDSSADYSGLGGGTCLRLLFGSSSTSDNKTDHSLKYISEMTIRIKGAPDITNGEAEDGSGNDDEKSGGAATPGESEKGSGNEGENTGNAGNDGNGGDSASSAQDSQTGSDGGDDGKGSQSASGKKKKKGMAPAGKTSNAANDGDARSDGDERDGSAADKAETAASQTVDSQAAETQVDETQAENSQAEAAEETPQQDGAPVEGEEQSSSQRWHAYQMLNPEDTSNLQIDALKDNPLGPWSAGIVIGTLLLGGIGSALSFRRQLGMKPFAGRIAYAAEE